MLFINTTTILKHSLRKMNRNYDFCKEVAKLLIFQTLTIRTYARLKKKTPSIFGERYLSHDRFILDANRRSELIAIDDNAALVAILAQAAGYHLNRGAYFNGLVAHVGQLGCN